MSPTSLCWDSVVYSNRAKSLLKWGLVPVRLWAPIWYQRKNDETCIKKGINRVSPRVIGSGSSSGLPTKIEEVKSRLGSPFKRASGISQAHHQFKRMFKTEERFRILLISNWVPIHHYPIIKLSNQRTRSPSGRVPSFIQELRVIWQLFPASKCYERRVNSSRFDPSVCRRCLRLETQQLDWGAAFL